ncbi:MAG: DUF6314 family protein [Rhizobiaceae bacterium]
MDTFADFFNTLIGEWSLSRAISTGEQMEGSLVFSRMDSSNLQANEVGDMRMASGNVISATRQWIWRIGDAGLQIYFDEDPPRLYHQVKPVARAGAWHGEGHHDCQPDTYVGDYLFSDNKIIIKQDVLGPNKDYQIISEYQRMKPTGAK